MPPTKPSLKSFKVVSIEGLNAYQEAETKAKAKRLKEIEDGLMVENGVYLDMNEVVTNPNLKTLVK